MPSKAKLRRRIRRLKRENLELIIESNAARVRAGQAYEAAEDQRQRYFEQLLTPNPAKLNG